MADRYWQCVGCGEPTPNRVRVCDCVTDALYRYGDHGFNEFAVKVDPPGVIRCPHCDSILADRSALAAAGKAGR